MSYSGTTYGGDVYAGMPGSSGGGGGGGGPVDIGHYVPGTPSARTARQWRPFGDMYGEPTSLILYRRPPQGTQALLAQLKGIRTYKPGSRSPLQVRLSLT